MFRVSLFPATLCFAVFRVSEFGRGCEGPCFVFRVSDFPRLFRACGALGLWRRLRRALTSQGRKPPTRCVDFAYEGRTDVTFGGNWYCQDPICMSDRLHAWAKLVCTCKQLRPPAGFRPGLGFGFRFSAASGFRVSPILPLGFGFRVSAWWVCMTSQGRGAEARKTNLNDFRPKTHMFPCTGKSSSVTRQPPASMFGRGLGELSSLARLPPRVQLIARYPVCSTVSEPAR